MDVQYFLNVLKKRKWLILLSVLIPAIVTFMIVSKQEDKFKSDAILAAGFIDYKGINKQEDQPFIQQYQAEMSYSNIIEFIQSRPNIRFLTYRLLLHDMDQYNANSQKIIPFRAVDKDEKDTDVDFAKINIPRLLDYMQKSVDSLDLDAEYEDEEMEINIYALAKMFEYDYESIREVLTVKRMGEADYISIDFLSEDAFLSKFVVKTITDEFLRHYRISQIGDYQADYDRFLIQEKEKEKILNSAKSQLEQYKLKKNLLNLQAESNAIVSQMQQLELLRERENKNIPSYESAINTLNEYLYENNQSIYSTKAQTIIRNEDIIEKMRLISSMKTQSINGADASLDSKIVLAEKQLDQQIQQLASIMADDKTDVKGMNEDLLTQRIDAELKLAIAKESVKSLDSELYRLRSKATSFVSDDAYITKMNHDIGIINDEYQDVKNKLNVAETKLKDSYNPLKIIQRAYVPDEPESKYQMILSGFAGLASGSMAVVILFLLAFLDMSLNSPHQFGKFTDLKLIGTVNEVKESDVDLKDIFNSNGKNIDLQNFKESLRKIRFALESSGAKTFLFTSTKDQEGKTFLIITLAYSLALMNKKILLIDTNFKNNSLTNMSDKASINNLLHTRLIGKNKLAGEFESKHIEDRFNLDHVDIIGNRGGYNSPSEIFAGKDFNNFIEELKQNYDYIFLEAASLNKYSDARELTGYVDKVINVFSANSDVKEADRDSMAYLKSLDGKFMGAILNRLNLKNLLN